MLKVTSIQQAKSSENILQSHIDDSELLSLASGVLQKLIPTHVKDIYGSSFGELKKIINYLSTHFESFEKSAMINMQMKFKEKRFGGLKELIAKDKTLLATCI